MSKHIFWIASYPKSGNTLLRSVLSSLFFSNDGKFNFDLLTKIVTLEEISRLRTVKGLESKKFIGKSIKDRSSLIFDHLYDLKKKSKLGFNEDFAFFKTHFNTKNFDKRNFLISEYIRGIIYIVRDPRDICVSWARYSKLSIDKSLDFLLNENAFIQWTGKQGASEYPENIPVVLSSWEKHVKSWIDAISIFPHLIIKYEDLVYDKEKVLYEILNYFNKHFGIKVENERIKIKNIIKTTSFDNMQNEEKNKGYKESNVSQFFRVGRKDQWKKVLNKDQISLIEKRFASTMSELKYQLSIEI